MKKILDILLTGILFTLLLSACANSNNQQYTQTKILMDTPIKLTAYGRNADKAVEESFQRLSDIEQMASTNISTSDVAKINSASGKEYVKVHPEIIKMIETTIKYSELSGGAWDITIGPIINLWSIGTDNARIPSDSEIKAKLPLVGYERYFEKDGKRYHHIINPATGYPTDNGVMSDTIIISGETEDSNMLADLLTTTAFVSGPEKAIKLADSLPNVALELTTTDYKIYTSSGFKDRITNLNNDFKIAN